MLCGREGNIVTLGLSGLDIRPRAQWLRQGDYNFYGYELVLVRIGVHTS